MNPHLSPRLVQTSRGPLEYADSGDGPAVLAIHGAMGGYDQSDILTRTIGEPGYRYLAVSRPGYLGTPLATGRTPEEQADRYAGLLDSLGVRAAAIMAVSGGGPSALQFALRHRDRCWALVLVSTCSGVVTTRVPLVFGVFMRLARWRPFGDALRRRTERDPEAAARRSIRDPAVLRRLVQDPEAWPLLQELQVSTSDAMGLRIAGTENDIRVTRSTSYPLEQIAVPTLVVHGTADRMVPYAEHGGPLAARIPGARRLVIEGGEHVAIFTHREQVRPTVCQFLREHAPRATDV